MSESLIFERPIGVAFEGGGDLGRVYPGAVSVLEEVDPNWGADIRFAAGTSAGSLAAAIVGAGLRSEDQMEILNNLPGEAFKRNKKFPFHDLVHLWRQGGWYRTEGVIRWVDSLVERLIGDKNATLFEYWDKTGVQLIVDAVEETTQRGHIRFSPTTHPEIKVSEAIVASISIPIWFPASSSQEYPALSDGGLLSNHPVDALAQRGLSPLEVIGFRVDAGEELEDIKYISHLPPLKSPVRRLDKRVRNLARIILNEVRRPHVPDHYWPCIIRCDSGVYSPVDFDPDPEKDEFLFNSGREAALTWLSEKARFRIGGPPGEQKTFKSAAGDKMLTVSKVRDGSDLVEITVSSTDNPLSSWTGTIGTVRDAKTFARAILAVCNEE